jgi:hypothetical protein
MTHEGEGPPVSVPRAVLSGGGGTLTHRISLFGAWRDQRPLYTIGSWPQLVGRPARFRAVPGDRSEKVRIEGAGRITSVRARGELPAEINGTLEGPRPRPGRDLAVAVNGRIAAITRSFAAGSTERFTAILPEQAFRVGMNDVRVLLVGHRGRRPLLVGLPPAR